MENIVYVVICFVSSGIEQTTDIVNVFQKKEDAQKAMKDTFNDELKSYQNQMEDVEISQDENSSSIDYCQGEEVIEISIFERILL